MKRSQRNVLGAMIVALFLAGQLGAKNLIKNSEFDDGLKYWGSGYINTGAGASVTFSVNTDGLLSGDNCWQMDIVNGGAVRWDIQRTQALPLQAGVTYSISFMGMVEGTSSMDMGVVFEINVDPWTKYLEELVTLTDVLTEYSYEYTAEEDVSTNQLKFFPGATNNVIVYLDAIVVDDGEPETGVESEGTLPAEFSLEQNYPNPFNPSTEIRYDLPSEAHVTLTVFDLSGKTVANLVDGSQGAGSHTVHFDGQNLPSGTYLYRLDAGNSAFTKKMMLIK